MVIALVAEKIRQSIYKIQSFFHKKKQPLYARKVRFSYNGSEVLKNLNLSVKTSQIVAVVGKSGSGKSTFLNLVAGVLTSSFKGKVLVLGRQRGFAKEDIGYVPQEIAVVPDMTIEENLAFFGRINGISKNSALSAGRKLMSIMQLKVPLSRYPTRLSGGQRVRLNIIVSILHNPKIIILDEPFVGLDYRNRKLLWHFLEHQRNRRRTIILTTHMLTEAEHCADRIVLLHKGRIFAKGNIGDIREKLKTMYVVEYKFKYLSKGQEAAIRKYCADHEIAVLDTFNNYMMFSITSEGQKNYLSKFFEKQKLEFREMGFREPNLDEVFLGVGA